MSSTRLIKDQLQASEDQCNGVPFAAHQNSDSTRLAKVEANELRRAEASDELREERNNDDQNSIAPCDTIVQKA